MPAPKKPQLPDRAEFAGRKVFQHTSEKTTAANLSKLDMDDVMMHAGGYYSVPNKPKKKK